MTYAFTDGSPFYELTVAIMVMLAALGIGTRPKVSAIVDGALLRLATWIRARGLFRIEGIAHEQRTLDGVRIGVGLLALANAARDCVAGFASGDQTAFAVQLVAVVLSVAVTLGIATPIAALAFALLVNSIIDNLTYSSNLASMVLSMILLVLAFAPAGTTMSLDGLLLRHPGASGHGWRRCYGAWGTLTEDRSTLARGVAFVSYAAISAYSALLHVGDVAWTTGLVNAWLFVSPWSNPSFYREADYIYSQYPGPFVLFSQLSTLGTVVWQLTMLPLALLGRWARYAVITWGLAVLRHVRRHRAAAAPGHVRVRAVGTLVLATAAVPRS